MAFQPGEHVVYPGYGAGTVVVIEDRVFSGTKTRYYMLQMVADQGEFLVPVDQAESLRIRPVLDSEAILGVLRAPSERLSPEYKERQAGITKLLSTSDAIQLGRGARDLAWYAGTRSLTGRDVQLYQELQTLLASELSLAEDIGLEEAREKLAQILAGITEQAVQAGLEADEEAAREAA